MVPVAPGRFSTTKGLPSCSPMLRAMARATVSVEPPAGKGTMMLTALSGKLPAACAVRASAAPSVIRIFFMFLSPGGRKGRTGPCVRSCGLLRAELVDQGLELFQLGGLEVRQRGAHGACVVADQLGAGLDDAHAVAFDAVADLQVGHEEFLEQLVLRGHVVGA